MQKRGKAEQVDANFNSNAIHLKVSCGSSPDPPEGGSKTFQNKPDGSTVYDTEVNCNQHIYIDGQSTNLILQVEYSCSRGSQFLLQNTHLPKLTNKCLWRRSTILVYKINSKKLLFRNQHYINMQQFYFKGPGPHIPACLPVKSPIVLICQQFLPQATLRRWTTSGQRWGGPRG